MQMLDYEYGLLIKRLDADRGDHTRFFVYANTVAVGSRTDSAQECHGWMGVRVQSSPRLPPSDIILHVRMWDKTPQLQQDALGIIGVNFIYASFFLGQKPDEFIPSLADNLGVERVEVDMLEFHGPDFRELDNRAMSFKLMQYGLTHAVMFGPKRAVLQPSEVFHKKPVLVERGAFRPITDLNVDMIEKAGAQFARDNNESEQPAVRVLEISVNNLLSEGKLDMDDFLARVDTVTLLGYPVVISNFSEYYRLGEFFRRFTQQPVAMIMGLNNLFEVFNEKYYENLPGGILEACGRLFKRDTRLYVYPMRGDIFSQYLRQRAGFSEANKRLSANAAMLITADNVQFPTHLRSLYHYLRENGLILPIGAVDDGHLSIYSWEILRSLRRGEQGWENSVPKAVASLIKEEKLFGYGSEKE